MKKRMRKKRPVVDKGLRLRVLNVRASEVECQLATAKQKTITFKFDLDEAETTDVAFDISNSLVRMRPLVP
jgi:hypothetical protein